MGFSGLRMCFLSREEVTEAGFTAFTPCAVFFFSFFFPFSFLPVPPRTSRDFGSRTSLRRLRMGITKVMEDWGYIRNIIRGRGLTTALVVL
jgi:hypothetical protein